MGRIAALLAATTPVVHSDKLKRADSVSIVRQVSADEVLGYENPDLVHRYMTKLGLSPDEAEILFTDTKKFLYLCGTQRGKWSPTPKVDDGWHHFLMFTVDYRNFCNKFFGRFIDHNPHRLNEPKGDGSQTRNTILAAKELFGELSPNWQLPKSAKKECSDGSCGGCEGQGCEGVKAKADAVAVVAGVDECDGSCEGNSGCGCGGCTCS